MIAAVLDSQVALDTVITEWIESYEKSADEALLNLTNFLIRSCGCTQFVTTEEFNDNDNLLETLQDILIRYKQVIQLLFSHMIRSSMVQYNRCLTLFSIVFTYWLEHYQL